MKQLLQRLQNNAWTTLVSLPRNDLELAKAALDGGAQGLKVHLNVEHFASGTKFGTFEEERDVLAQIVEMAAQNGASVGVVPGANGVFAAPQEFAGLREIGVDYFDAYPFDCPAWALFQTDLDVMLAAFNGFKIEEFAEFETLGMTLCEASFLGHDDYGKPLSALDVAKYRALCGRLKSPVIIPSQKKLEARDVSALQTTGARGVLIGAIVTGREAASIEAATRAFCGA